MIFQHTLDAVLDGTKTQTSRLWKDSYFASFVSPNSDAICAIYIKPNGKFRIQYEVGQRLAIQPGRGKKGVGCIEITSLTKRDVRLFDAGGFKREGFQYSTDFYLTWLEMHNRKMYERCLNIQDLSTLEDFIQTGLASCYAALVIGFKLVEVY